MSRRWRISGGGSIWCAATLGVFLLGTDFAAAQTPSPALLVLEKSDNTLAIVDPVNLKIMARVPDGPDPMKSPHRRMARWRTSRTTAATTAP